MHKIAISPASINEMYIAFPDILAATPKIEKIPAPIIPPIPIEIADNNPMGFFVFNVDACKVYLTIYFTYLLC